MSQETKEETVSKAKTDEGAKTAPENAILTEVAELEDKFAEDTENADVRSKLHTARVKAGWSEFLIDTVSGADPRLTIPWVAVLAVKYEETWGETPGQTGDVPEKEWLKNEVDILERGRVRKKLNAHFCMDGKWRRDVEVEDLAHLCSIVSRMEDVILYKPDAATGLMKLTIFDQRAD
jgi:hypothetical protein